MDAIELLKNACDKSSQGKVAAVLGISKTSVNLLLKGTYPNPTNMHKKILDTYGEGSEIIGVVAPTNSLKDLAKELEEL